MEEDRRGKSDTGEKQEIDCKGGKLVELIDRRTREMESEKQERRRERIIER